jgi:hypothetical protein
VNLVHSQQAEQQNESTVNSLAKGMLILGLYVICVPEVCGRLLSKKKQLVSAFQKCCFQIDEEEG